jgi:hypothetical protein
LFAGIARQEEAMGNRRAGQMLEQAIERAPLVCDCR